jgi:GNAT superfamily N-acetyltransferase
MSDRIRRADPETDRALLIELLSQNLTPEAGGRRFDWLYLDSPHGRARVWVVTEGDTGRGLGVAAAFPRRLFVHGRLRDGYVLGDFAIEPRHRNLGLALQLQRASLDQLAVSSTSPAYDFPSDRMMAIYRRMRLSPASQMIRWAKPLRTDRKIKGSVKSAELASLLAAPLNVLLKWTDFSTHLKTEWTIAKQVGACTEEFTHLAHSIGSQYGSCVERSAEHLNWRYLQHPLVPHELWTARRDAKLAGYVVFSHTGDDARIVDLFGFSDTEMWTALVAQVVSLVRVRGAVTLSISATASSPWSARLKKWGFRLREGSPFLVCGTAPAKNGVDPDSNDSWFVTEGDRES